MAKEMNRHALCQTGRKNAPNLQAADSQWLSKKSSRSVAVSAASQPVAEFANVLHFNLNSAALDI
jgi:hypothetical protein